MNCVRTWSFESQSLTAANGTLRYVWKTAWILMDDDAKIVATLRIASIGANSAVFLVHQTAEVRPDDPDTPATIGTSLTATTQGTARSATLTGTGKLWVRFGYAYQLTGGSTTEATAEVGMDMALHQCVGLVGHRVVEQAPGLPAGSGIGDSAIYLLTDFEPAVGSPSFKAAIIARNLSNATDTRLVLVYRTANDKGNPDAWTLGEAGWDTPGGSPDERNTGTMSPTTTDKMWIQWAFAVRRNTGGATIQGDFDVTLVKML